VSLLTVAQVADRLNVSRKTADNLLQSGQLRFVDVSVRAGCFGVRKQKRVFERDLEAFIKSRTTNAVVPQPEKSRRSKLLPDHVLRLL
jgi:excisionase family DNA binding protein